MSAIKRIQKGIRNTPRIGASDQTLKPALWQEEVKKHTATHRRGELANALGNVHAGQAAPVGCLGHAKIDRSIRSNAT